jgi:adenylosuccinate lyase
MENIKVYPERMRENIESSMGVIFSQLLLLAMIEKGVSREKASEIISADAKTAWEQDIDFQYLVLEDERINTVLSRQEIMSIFDYERFRSNIDFIFERAGL